MASGRFFAEGNDQDDVVFAPYTTVKNRLSGRSFIAQILADTSSPDDIPAAQEELALIIRDSRELADWEEDDFTVRNQTELAEATDELNALTEALQRVDLGIYGGCSTCGGPIPDGRIGQRVNLGVALRGEVGNNNL